MSEVKRAAALGLALAAAACRPGARAEATGSGGAAGLDAGLERPCGLPGAACAPDEFCAFDRRLCGKGARPGQCQKRPTDCRAERYAPVCGCDGKIRATECEAHAAGSDLDVNGACRELVPDWITCGARLCDAHTSYCEIVLSDVVDPPTDYTCKPLPPACVPEGGVARSCDCFPAGTRCLSFCGYTETGGLAGFHLTCRL